MRKNLRKEAKSKGKQPDDVSDHRFAEMLALRSPPGLNGTDSAFFEGMGTLEQQFGKDKESLRETIAAAKRHGYTPNPRDVYLPTLAAFEGDPLAFVPPTGGRGHIKKVSEMRGWESRGAVTVKGRQPEKDPLEGPRLAEDLVQPEIKAIRAKDPKARKVADSELRQEVINKHAPKL